MDTGWIEEVLRGHQIRLIQAVFLIQNIVNITQRTLLVSYLYHRNYVESFKKHKISIFKVNFLDQKKNQIMWNDFIYQNIKIGQKLLSLTEAILKYYYFIQ